MFNTSCLVIKFNQDVNRFKLARKQMQANCFIDSLFSDINNSISAPALGAGGRGFESRYPDEKGVTLSSSFFICEKILFQMQIVDQRKNLRDSLIKHKF